MIYNVYIYKNRFLLIDISSHMHFWMAGPLIFCPHYPREKSCISSYWGSPTLCCCPSWSNQFEGWKGMTEGQQVFNCEHHLIMGYALPSNENHLVKNNPWLNFSNGNIDPYRMSLCTYPWLSSLRRDLDIKKTRAVESSCVLNAISSRWFWAHVIGGAFEQMSSWTDLCTCHSYIQGQLTH